MRLPPADGNAVRVFSMKENVAVPVEVPPTGMLPAEVTLVEARAKGAAAVATNEPSSATDAPTRAAFLRRSTVATSDAGGSVSPVARRGPGGRGMDRVSEPPANWGEAYSGQPLLARAVVPVRWQLAPPGAGPRTPGARPALLEENGAPGAEPEGSYDSCMNGGIV